MKITEYCKLFNKLPSNFLSTKVCRGNPNIKVTEGCSGGTEIPDELIKPFFLWLDISTKSMVLEGKTGLEIEEWLRSVGCKSKN